MAIILKMTGSGTYGGGEFDYALQLSNEEISRCICVTGSWKHIRLGMRLNVSQSSGPMNSTLAFGLSSGTGSLYNSPNTRYFIGMRISSSTTLIDGPRSGGGTAGYGKYGDVDIITRTGSTEMIYNNTPLSMSIGGKNYVNECRRSLHFLDFIKPDGYTDPGLIHVIFNYPTYQVFPPSNIEIGNSTYSQFYNAFISLTASFSDSDYIKYECDIPLSESVYGLLDNIDLYWSNTTRSLDISDVGVSIFYWM